MVVVFLWIEKLKRKRKREKREGNKNGLSSYFLLFLTHNTQLTVLCFNLFFFFLLFFLLQFFPPREMAPIFTQYGFLGYFLYLGMD